MKKPIDTLLILAVIIPIVFLFCPFAQWTDVASVILRVIPSLAVQTLLCRIAKWNIVKTIPTLLTGVFAAWGIYLFFASPHWSNATVAGLIADYVSPFISCAVVLIVYLIIQKMYWVLKR